MTDRIAEQGAVQYAQENPVSSGVSRLGAAGSLQAAIADALSGGRSSLNGVVHDGTHNGNPESPHELFARLGLKIVNEEA